MIRLTRLNRAPLVLNSDLIEHIDVTPDTVITLTTGQILRVRETAEEVIRRIIEFRRQIFGPDGLPIGTSLKNSTAASASWTQVARTDPWHNRKRRRRPKTREAEEAPASSPIWPRSPGLRLRSAGILGGLMLEKGNIQDVMQGTAAMIVLGGTFGAVLVTTPLPVVLRAFRGLGTSSSKPASRRGGDIEALIQYAGKARKNGIVSLEAEAAAIADPFLRRHWIWRWTARICRRSAR